MTMHSSTLCTAFDGMRLFSAGPLGDVVLALKAAAERGDGPFLIFEDATGRVIDVDLRGSESDVLARLPSRRISADAPLAPSDGVARGPGRPKLGVVGREVTLLPRHWDWLAEQPGGASVTLRKLVEEARRTGGPRQKTRLAHEAAYRVMVALGGDLPGFEEATRALFAANRPRFEQEIAGWPDDLRGYVTRLAFEG